MVPNTPGSRMAERAVNMLLAAGMVLRYRSGHGNSFYLGWPGRSGVLRVSDHPQSHQDNAVLGRLTFADLKADCSEEQLNDRVAVALGRYLMKAPRGKASSSPHGADWVTPQNQPTAFTACG